MLAAALLAMIHLQAPGRDWASLIDAAIVTVWRGGGQVDVPDTAEGVAGRHRVGLILPLGRSVRDSACCAVHRWRAHGDLGVSANIAARQLASPSLPAEVTTALRRAALEASALTLEITERPLLDSHAIGSRLAELNALGVRVAIDASASATRRSTTFGASRSTCSESRSRSWIRSAKTRAGAAR